MAILDPIFNPILEAIGWLLSIFYAAVPAPGGASKQDYALGVSIILLTFTIMLLLFPLTAKQARSMIAMQMVQPEIKRIQAKYKNDKAKLNEEMMKFYQENKINPLAGCLPLLAQLPIFFALFNVLRNPYKYVPDTSELYRALCTNPETGRVVSENACGDIKGLPIHQKFLGMDLSLSAPDQTTTWATILGFTLVALVMFTGYMQSRQAQKRTPAINKQMALITKVLPVFFGFISLQFPAGLVVYFFVSNLWRLGQQEVIFRRYGTAHAPKHKSLVKGPKADVVDAASRERANDGKDGKDGNAAIEAADETADGATTSAPAKRRGGGTAASRKVAAAPSAKGNGGVAKPVIAPTPAGGGLRALFRPPPPPTGKPEPVATAKTTKTGAKPSPAKKSTPTAPTSRPGEAGRRISKKRKKR